MKMIRCVCWLLLCVSMSIPGIAEAQTPEDIRVARKLRADAAYLEMKGDVAGAIGKYEESLTRLHDDAIVRKLAELRGEGAVDRDRASAKAVSKLCPGPWMVQVRAAPSNDGVAGALVRLGGRAAYSNAEGVAVLDGVPSGDYTLQVGTPGYEYHEKKIGLPDGSREEAQVLLIPEPVSQKVEGKVFNEGTIFPIAGARLRFDPVEVRSWLKGPCETVTGWDGKFTLTHVPSGTYRLRISAAGFQVLDSEVVLENNGKVHEFGLRQIIESASLNVKVVDALSRSGIAGATVILAEAYPVGEIATGQTNQSGGFSSGDIRISQINWTDDEGRCRAPRRQVTLHVSCEGYASMTLPVVLTKQGSAEVALYSVRQVEELESNNGVVEAQDIDIGSRVVFALTDPKDEDWFKFRLPYDGKLIVEVGPDNALQTVLSLLNAEGKTVATRNQYEHKSNRIEVNVHAGEYRVGISEWDKNASSETPMTLTLGYEATPDPMPSGSSMEGARLIRVNEEFRGYLNPLGEVDWYRFEVKRPGVARLQFFPMGLQRMVSVLDADGKQVARGTAYENQLLSITTNLIPGTYTVQVEEWDRNACSLEPYSARLEWIEDDGVDDGTGADGIPVWSRVLPVDSLTANTVLPLRDVDNYLVAIPGPGIFNVFAQAPIQLHVSVLTPEGRVLARGTAYEGGRLDIEYHANQAETVVVEIREWGDNHASHESYVLGNSFRPADEMDSMSRNDQEEFATPFVIGDTLRGNILPLRDRDLYSFHVDHPGWLDLEFSNPMQILLALMNSSQVQIGRWTAYEKQGGKASIALLSGDYLLAVHEWDDNAWTPLPYAISTAFRMAEPNETDDMARDPVRALPLDHAAPLKIEHLRDRDRYRIDLPAEGSYMLSTIAPIQRTIVARDILTGSDLFRVNEYENALKQHTFDVKGPTRLEIEVNEWDDNASSMDHGTLMVSGPGKQLIAEKLNVRVDRVDPTLVWFNREAMAPYPMALKVTLDADGDGNPDLDLPQKGEVSFRYAQEGVYHASAWLQGQEGVTGESTAWVNAVGYRERKGVHLLVSYPRSGELVSRAEMVRASAMSYSGARIGSVEVSVDGKSLAVTHTSPFRVPVQWDSFGPGRHRIKVKATDTKGVSQTVERDFEVSEYYDLFPADGTQVTGDQVVVAWKGRTFGSAAVRYRKAGEREWTGQVNGQNGRSRRVTLSGLEPGVRYEVQPVGAGEGPVIQLTRVKGLAFGKPAYAAAIKRDYDQRVGVSVRNHGESPLNVRLECGEPPSGSQLYVGFVGEGSEGVPFSLNPGEERDFMLGISAQDCLEPKVRFPIRIVPVGSGPSDEAIVELDVKLPNVVLEWEDKGEIAGAIGRKLVLHNKGDTLTDLSVASIGSDLGMRPTIDHGLFPAGQSMEFQVIPRLYEGFTAASGQLVAKSVNKELKLDQSVALKDGQMIHAVDIGPEAEDPHENEVQAERALAAAYLNPDDVDWSRKTNPEDTDGDGKIDRWTVDIPWESTRWYAMDTDGDGEIDLVQGDVGPDGRADYAALRGGKGWEETNLVNAQLEMGFKLPWSRDSYEKHDADIVFNGTVIGKLRDTVPEGNYSFDVPVSAFNFNSDGSAGPNEVKIQSRHLRGGHYVVTSDFRMKANLTGTRVYTAAVSEAEARQSVYGTPGLVLSVPDLSLSSAAMSVQGGEKSGTPIRVSAPLRNLGSGPARQVTVALYFGSGSTDDVELARTAIAEIPPNAAVDVVVEALAPAGDGVLRLVVDPDQSGKDADRVNNEARQPFRAEGDEEPPTLEIVDPKADAVFDTGVIGIKVEASDNEGIARVDVRVNQGLWSSLKKGKESGYEGTLHLQPGSHTVHVRALDTSGNPGVKTVAVKLDGESPQVEWKTPDAGKEIGERECPVLAEASQDVEHASVRVNGGAWRRLGILGRRIQGNVPLVFGDVRLELMVMDKHGVKGYSTREITCTWQPQTEEESQDETPDSSGEEADRVEVPGLGPVDPHAPDNQVYGGSGSAVQDGTGSTADSDNDTIVDEDESAELEDVGDVDDEDGLYGSEPFEEDPDLSVWDDEDEDALAEEELEDEIDGDEWLNDPEVDTEEPEAFVEEAEEPDPNYEMPDMESWDEMPVDDAATEAPEDEDAVGGFPDAGNRIAPLPPLGDVPGYVGMQQNQSDWYCTNRPDIGVKFTMPDWLKKMYLPKPGSKEFEAMFQKRLAALKAQGMDTSQLEKLRNILRNRCNRADMPTELPSFLESLGFSFGYKPKANPAELAEWRAKMADAADSFMLRLLHSNDPMLIAYGLQSRMDALGSFDQAAMESAQAALETVKASQKITEEVAMAIPYLNIAVSAHALWSGENLSGDKLGKLDTALHLLTIAGPAYQLFKNPSLRQAAAGLGNKAMWMGEKTLTKLATNMGIKPAQLKAMMQNMSNGLANARIKAGEKIMGKAWAEGQRFMNSPAGKEAAARAARDVKQAESLLHRIAQAKAAGDKVKYRELIGRLQGNKTAQGLLNSPKYSNQFRNTLDKTHRAMGRLADKGTIKQFMQTDTARKEIEALARKFGVKPGDIVVKARNISGNTKTMRNLKSGEMLKYGADRDVVFQYCVKGKHAGWKSLKDVHHKAIENIYNSNLKRVTGRSAHSMDHVVTSRWNPEAYNAGLNPNTRAGQQAIDDIISGRSAGKLKRPADVRDTVIHKGREWMESGSKWANRGAREGKDVYIRIGNQKVREGMRQMSKEYNRQVAQFIKAKGLNPSKVLPPRLNKGLEIFRKVEQGMPVEQAREMLKAMTPKGGVPITPETIADDLGNFVEFLNRWGLPASP